MVVVVKARDRKYRLVFCGGSQGGLEYPRMVFFRGRSDAPPKINIVGFMYKNMSGIIRYYKGRKLTVLFSGGVIPHCKIPISLARGLASSGGFWW